MFQTALDLPGQYINLRDPVNLIAEKFYPDRRIAIVCRKNLHCITAHPECTTVKIHVISCVLDIDQCTDDLISVLLHSRTQRNHHSKVVLRAAQTIDTGNRGDHDHIFTLYKCRRGRQAQFINLLIDCRILGNISVRLWHICLRLIIIVIGDKIFHCITPSKVSNWLPSLKPLTSSSIACGWSPVGWYGACNLKICCSFCTKVTSGGYLNKVWYIF